MRWESSEWTPFLEFICVDNDTNDGRPAVDPSSHRPHYDDGGVFGSTSCAEL
jgi:hypothetical protein